LSLPEHEELLSRTGCSDVKIFEDYEKGWMCAMGMKPSKLATGKEPGMLFRSRGFF
jgi:hypothetical protein